MSSALGDTYDLGAVAERLKDDATYRVFTGAVAKFMRLHSLRTDVQHAEEHFGTIGAIQMSDRYVLGTIEQALLYSGIILYARGTSTSSDHRKQYDIRNRLSTEQKLVHQELCGLRDDAVAHYGPGKSYKGEWMRETAILHVLPTGEGKTAGVARRITVDPALLKRAVKQTRAARMLIEQSFQAVSEELALEINRLACEDSAFKQIVGACELDLAQYLGSAEAAASAVQAYDFGQASGVISHR